MSVSIVIRDATHAVDRWTLRQPSEGRWSADLRYPAAGTQSGDAILLRGESDDRADEWLGTVTDTTSLGAYDLARVVAGADGLDLPTQPRYYAGGVSPASVLADLCADAGETPGAAPSTTLPAWRSRGGSLRDELDRLAGYVSGGAWRIDPGGAVALDRASGAATPPGLLLSAERDERVYEVDGLPPLAGLQLGDWTVGTAIYSRGPGRTTVAVWRAHGLAPAPPAAVVAGTVVSPSSSSGRVDVRLDDGTQLTGLPLWSAAGYLPHVANGARVLVLDLADDPRATIALAAAADSGVSRIDLAGGQSDVLPLGGPAPGRVLRYGDTIMAPTGPAATPAPLVLMPPPAPVPVSRVRA
jgi:hypothetical protein